MIVSTAANVGHALLTAPEQLRGWAALAAALPPIALFGITEGLAITAGGGTRRWAYRLGVAGAICIAMLAFVLSFAAMRDLAVLLGFPAAVAAGWPLLADASIAVASVMLLATKPAAAADAHPTAVPAADADHVAVPAPTSADLHSVTAHELVAAGVVRAEPAAVAAAVAGLAAGDSHRAVALATGLHRTSVARVAERVAAAG